MASHPSYSCTRNNNNYSNGNINSLLCDVLWLTAALLHLSSHFIPDRQCSSSYSKEEVYKLGVREVVAHMEARGQPQQCHSLDTAHLVSLRQDFSLSWNSPIKLVRLSGKAQAFSCLCHPCLGITRKSPSPPLFHVFLGLN